MRHAGRCLFSAPWSFAPDLRSEFDEVIETEFRVIWSRDQIGWSAGIVAWIMNPGQDFRIDDAVLDHFPDLEVLVTPSTGRNHVDEFVCRRRGIPLYSLLDDRPALERISASAEFTFLHILNSMRRFDRAVGEMAAGRWRRREDSLRGREIAGKTVGLVGLGRIGRRIARYAACFEARVVYHDPLVEERAIPLLTLEELFAASDVVCICCSLTEETANMVNWKLLSRLKPGACLVNTSRGEVIREEDLARLLAAREDLTVGLDVLAGETEGAQFASPLAPFIDKGQVVVTPHVAGATVESQARAARIALGLLRAHLEARDSP